MGPNRSAGATSTDQLYRDPKSGDAGLASFTRMVDGKGPDPLYAGQAFRQYMGDPLAGELIARGQAEKLPELVIGAETSFPRFLCAKDTTGPRRSAGS